MMRTNTWRNLGMAAAIAASSAAGAATIDVLVGDKDGFGIGCSNHAAAGTCIWPGHGNGGSLYDGRSAAEASATNGAQITDIYSALFPQFGPNNFTEADVLLPFTGTLLSGIVHVASGDRQVAQGGPVGFSINGVTELFATEQGFQGTGIDDYTLTAAELAAANAIGMVVLHYNHFFPGDLIAFDWFELTGETNASTPPPNGAPEPGTLWLGAIAALVAAGGRRRTR
jgi:hypothetical protein